jgi:hypothetical protein
MRRNLELSLRRLGARKKCHDLVALSVKRQTSRAPVVAPAPRAAEGAPPPKAVQLAKAVLPVAAARPAKGEPPYLLQVMTRIERKDLSMLERLGDQLVRLIEDEGWDLVHASCEVSNTEVDLYLHWNIGTNSNALLEAELNLPDKPAYARFERAIVFETKELVRPVTRMSRPVDLVPGERYVYLRATYNVKTQKLAEFQARLEESLVPFAKINGWMLGDAFLGITGVSGSITQLWLVPERSMGIAQARLARATWQDLLTEPPVCKFLDPLNIDPTFGQGQRPTTSVPDKRYSAPPASATGTKAAS